MGTWSFESFGNDAAGDWIIYLLETPTFEFLEKTLKQHDKGDGDPYPMLEAIAAAEVVCILKGNGPFDYNADKHGSNHNLDAALKNLQAQPMPDGIVTLASEVVMKIESSEEFRELSEEIDEYHEELKSLISRLSQIK